MTSKTLSKLCLLIQKAFLTSPISRIHIKTTDSHIKISLNMKVKLQKPITVDLSQRLRKVFQRNTAWSQIYACSSPSLFKNLINLDKINLSF
jgi:hypothetical protein